MQRKGYLSSCGVPMQVRLPSNSQTVPTSATAITAPQMGSFFLGGTLNVVSSALVSSGHHVVSSGHHVVSSGHHVVQTAPVFVFTKNGRVVGHSL